MLTVFHVQEWNQEHKTQNGKKREKERKAQEQDTLACRHDEETNKKTRNHRCRNQRTAASGLRRRRKGGVYRILSLPFLALPPSSLSMEATARKSNSKEQLRIFLRTACLEKEQQAIRPIFAPNRESQPGRVYNTHKHTQKQVQIWVLMYTAEEPAYC